MAKIFLESNDTFTQSSTNTGDTIFGGTGSETVILQGNPDGTLLDGNVEEVQVAGNAADTTLQVNAQGQLELSSGGTVYATFTAGLNAAVDLQFEDGNVTLKNTAGGVFTVEDPADDTDSATIDANTAQTGDAVTLGTDDSTAGDGSGGGGAGGGTGQTFALTTAGGTVDGTSGDDTFIAPSEALGVSVVNAGGGTDTLNATVATADNGISVNASDLEIMDFRATNNIALDIGSVTGVTEVYSNRSTGDLTLEAVDLSTTVGMRRTDNNLTVEFDSVGGTSDAATLELDRTEEGAEFVAAGVETLNVATEGTAGSVIDLQNGTNVFTTLNVTGAQNLNSNETLEAVVETVDASAFTGDLTVDVSAAAEDLTVTGGEGDDVITTGTIGANDSIDGGDGTDILSTTQEDVTTANFTSSSISNIETVRQVFSSAVDADAPNVDASIVDGATIELQLADTDDDGDDLAATVTNATSTFDLVLDDSAAGGEVNDGDDGINVTVNIGALAQSDSDALTLTLENEEVLTFTASDYESVTLNSNVGDGNRIRDLDLTNAQTLTIAGSQDLVLNDVDMEEQTTTVASTLAAGAMTGDLTVVFGNDEGDQTITTGTGNDSVTLAAGSLDGDDTIDLGAGSDTLVVNLIEGDFAMDVSNVETLDFSSSAARNAAADIDVASAASTLETIEIDLDDGGNAVENIKFDNVADGVTTVVTDDFAATGDVLEIDLSSGASATTVRFDDAGADFVGSLTLTGVTTATLSEDNDQAGASVITTLDASSLETLNVTGAGDITVTNATNTDSVETLSAAGMTGNLTLNNFDRASDASITLGVGDDSLEFNTTTDTGNTISAGAGTDTLVLTGSPALGATVIDLSSTTNQITNVNGTVNTTAQTGFENLDASGQNSSGVNVTAAASGSEITGTGQADQINGGAAANTFTGGAGDDVITLTDNDVTDTINIAFGGEGSDTINDFEVGAGGDLIDFTGGTDVDNVTNPGDFDATTLVSNGDGTADTLTANDGLMIVDNGNADTNDAGGLTAADIEAYLADIDGNGDTVVKDANDAVGYLAVSDGTDTAIIKYLNGGGDTTIDEAEIVIVGTLTGVGDAGTLTAANFDDF